MITRTDNILCGTTSGIFLKKGTYDWVEVMPHSTREIIPDLHREGHYYAACLAQGVYRSTDSGQTWELLGESNPGGEPWSVMSVERVSYDWLYAGTYCRGAYRYDLEPMSIEGSELQGSTSVLWTAQNPSEGTVTLFVNQLNSPTALSVYDLSGRRVHTSEVEAGSGSVTAVLTDLPAGVYMATLNSSNQVCRFVVIR